MGDIAKPGHRVEIAKLKDLTGVNGINWFPDRVEMYEKGIKTDERAIKTDSPWEFWYGLAFRDAFPEVTHWFFASPWTQNVRMTQILGQNNDMEGDYFYGEMQFINENEAPEIFTITNNVPPEVDVPYPPEQVKRINIPLRLLLSKMVIALLSDDIIPNAWYAITSLVETEHLETIFPTDRYAYPFRLWRQYVDLRTFLCHEQSISKPQ
jgi:hypothetical protein